MSEYSNYGRHKNTPSSDMNEYGQYETPNAFLDALNLSDEQLLILRQVATRVDFLDAMDKASVNIKYGSP